MSEITKGEWRIAEWTTPAGFNIFTKNKSIAVVHTPPEHKPNNGEIQANARLIAAAPDMLAACEKMLCQLNLRYPEHKQQCNLKEKDCPDKQAIDKAKAAIAKAKSH